LLRSGTPWLQLDLPRRLDRVQKGEPKTPLRLQARWHRRWETPFFSSEETGKKWIANHEDTFLFGVEDAYEIGRLFNRNAFGAALKERTD